MHRVNAAAAFIHPTMTFGKGGSLSVPDAWDVAQFVNSHERTQEPSFSGNLRATQAEYHAHQCRYGDSVDKHVRGTDK